MIRLPNNGKKKQYPRIVNTVERKNIFLAKSKLTTNFNSRSGKILVLVDLLAKKRDLPYVKRMKYRRRVIFFVKMLRDHFVEMRRLEARLCEYDEMERLKYIKIK